MKGIVLRATKYGDTGLIVDLFTESHGRMSFMTKISHTRKSNISSAFWQPLTLIEFQADIRPNSKSLPKPKDIRIYAPFTTIPYSPIKSTIILFLAEFLSAALREEKANNPLYKYIESSLLWFNEANYPNAIANFHLVFLMHMTQFIGIYPNLDLTPTNPLLTTHSPHIFFDLLSGTYTSSQPIHSHFLKKEEAMKLPLLFRMKYQTMHLVQFSSAQRIRCIELLNTFYRIHLPNFPELKSTEILHEVFS